MFWRIIANVLNTLPPIPFHSHPFGSSDNREEHNSYWYNNLNAADNTWEATRLEGENNLLWRIVTHLKQEEAAKMHIPVNRNFNGN